MNLRVKFANSWIQKIVSKAANQPVDDQLFLFGERPEFAYQFASRQEEFSPSEPFAEVIHA